MDNQMVKHAIDGNAAIVSNALVEVREKAGTLVHRTRQQFDAATSTALRNTRNFADAGKRYVRRNPLQAVCVAAGVGLLCRVLANRR